MEKEIITIQLSLNNLSTSLDGLFIDYDCLFNSNHMLKNGVIFNTNFFIQNISISPYNLYWLNKANVSQQSILDEAQNYLNKDNGIVSIEEFFSLNISENNEYSFNEILLADLIEQYLIYHPLP